MPFRNSVAFDYTLIPVPAMENVDYFLWRGLSGINAERSPALTNVSYAPGPLTGFTPTINTMDSLITFGNIPNMTPASKTTVSYTLSWDIRNANVTGLDNYYRIGNLDGLFYLEWLSTSSSTLGTIRVNLNATTTVLVTNTTPVGFYTWTVDQIDNNTILRDGVTIGVLNASQTLTSTLKYRTGVSTGSTIMTLRNVKFQYNY